MGDIQHALTEATTKLTDLKKFVDKNEIAELDKELAGFVNECEQAMLVPSGWIADGQGEDINGDGVGCNRSNNNRGGQHTQHLSKIVLTVYVVYSSGFRVYSRGLV